MRLTYMHLVWACENSPCETGQYNISRAVDAQELHKRHAYSRNTNRFHRLQSCGLTSLFSRTWGSTKSAGLPWRRPKLCRRNSSRQDMSMLAASVCLPTRRRSAAGVAASDPVRLTSSPPPWRHCSTRVAGATSDTRGWRYRSSPTASAGLVQE